MNGELSLLDLDEGSEHEMTDAVELFWVTSGQPEEKANLVNEVSWLDYGHRGMQVNSHMVEEFVIFCIGLLAVTPIQTFSTRFIFMC